MMNLSFRRQGHGSHGNGAADKATEQLVSEFKAVVADTEDLLRSVADASGDGVELARARVRERLRDARSTLGETKLAARERIGEATRATERYVSDNPWRSVTTVFAIGALIGFLLHASRR